jgi:NitT/TauT family transport system permease protein
MSFVLRHWQAMLALALMFVALPYLPPVAGLDASTSTMFIIASLVVGSLAAMAGTKSVLRLLVLALAPHLAVWLLLSQAAQAPGAATTAFWFLLAASWLLAWRLASALAGIKAQTRAGDVALRLLIPTLFGVWILILWEAVVKGAGIPFVLLPPPSAVGVRIANSLPILAADVNQTIFKAVLIGYVMGCSTGFLAAIVADRFNFVRRGLLPVGNMVSALPIIGIAPIMVMWFGFDWQSKAAVVVVMTFFPMLVNTGAGLAESGHMERDLMRTYASGYWQTLAKLRLPAAMPFIFNALKINSTLALIGAIVAEFFGTPVVGMGFRISTEVGRMNVDMVWAEIAVAALAGSVFYGVIALAERAVTFWHPSIRGG